MSDYSIKLDVFEGPLDLLMHLIEKNKVDIYDIPIVEITGQYLAYLDRFKEYNIEIASEFLVMAANLLYIKSRLLLPLTAAADSDESEEELDPRQELVERLIEYRRFKAMSGLLSQLGEEQARLFYHVSDLPTIEYLPLAELDVKILAQAFAALKETAVEETTVVVREEFNIQDKIAGILALLTKSSGRIELTDIVPTRRRAEIVAAFLALLELIKLKKIIIEQATPFAAIFICLREEQG